MTDLDVRDNRMWRKALAMAHPDRKGGDRDVFEFLSAVRERVQGDAHAEGRTAESNFGHDAAAPQRAAAYHQAAARGATFGHPLLAQKMNPKRVG